MKIVIVTDAWKPQVNGVVQTLMQTRQQLIELGHELMMITPEDFNTVPCPTYPSISLALFPGRRVAKLLSASKANAVHIATEGPLGMAARRWCIKHAVKFTSSYHTQFPEYVRLRVPIPVSWTYALLRWFHRKAEHTLVPTRSQQKRLEQHGFKQVVVWGRGVDVAQFSAAQPQQLSLPRPLFVNMGRVAVEKNIQAFLDLPLPGSKMVIGDGPDRHALEQRYPQVLFTGAKFGKELASWLAAADVFVFPSKTDTFGLVILEAMACGVPVAAYPVTGPVDIIQEGINGCLDEDLALACLRALKVPSANCLQFAQENSWYSCTQTFESYMVDNHHHKSKTANSITNMAG